MENEWSSLPFPGKEEAELLGYTMYSHSGNHQRASYQKDGVFLDVWYSDEGLSAQLSFVWHFILVSFGNDGRGFSFPNGNFASFESWMQKAKQALAEIDSRGEPF